MNGLGSWPWHLAKVKKLRSARLEIVEQGIVFIVEVLLGPEDIPRTSTLLLFNLVAKMNAKEGGIDCVLVALLQRLD